jgi:hypothetical protein
MVETPEGLKHRSLGCEAVTKLSSKLKIFTHISDFACIKYINYRLIKKQPLY